MERFSGLVSLKSVGMKIFPQAPKLFDNQIKPDARGPCLTAARVRNHDWQTNLKP